MKKLFFVMVGVLVMGTAAYAQMPTAKSASSSAKSSAPLNLIERVEGKITAIRAANLSQQDFGGFSLIDDSGKKQDFDLIANTHFFSSKSAPLAFSDFKKGDKVHVLYIITLRETNELITVTRIK